MARDEAAGDEVARDEVARDEVARGLMAYEASPGGIVRRCLPPRTRAHTRQRTGER